MNPYRITFVCSGNICRSPMAAVVLRHQVAAAGLAGRVKVDSAALQPRHAGSPADPRTVAVLTAAGYTPDLHTARLFRPRWFHSRDLVVALDRNHEHALRRAAPTGTGHKVRLLRGFDQDADAPDVADPYRNSAAAFTACLHAIEPATRGLLNHLQHALTQGEQP